MRQLFSLLDRLDEIINLLGMPWLLLACRLWLGQTVLVSRVMPMMIAATHTWPDATYQHTLANLSVAGGVRDVVEVIAPVSLMFGLLTHPAALILLLQAAAAAANDAGGTVRALLEVAPLLAWLAAVGAGPFSLDRLLGYGLVWSALRPAQSVARLYNMMTEALAPVALLLLRCGAAVLIALP